MKQSHLVMLPGWGMEREVFQPCIESLSNIFDLSFVEWRHIKAPIDFEERVIQEITSIHTPIFLLGWSLGTLTALKVASLYPERIKGLILFSGTSRFTSCEQYPSGWQPRVVKRMKKQLQEDKDKTLTLFYEAMFSQPEQDKGQHHQFIDLVQREFQGDDMLSLMVGLDYLIETDYRSLLNGIKTPCLLIHGTEDTICPLAASSFINDQLGEKAHFSIMNETGHLPFFTKPDECMRLIKKFVQRMEDE
ncbi:alpha/beta fold hydrolase [Ectobacillus funiculus]|uniref:Alpha/beta fold hydrolase n=1 Tax=Ectobacillus funiculus TaxID=137993 RepID=A0ABV5WKY6_9BACI